MSWLKGVVTRFHSNCVSVTNVENGNNLQCVLRGKFKQQRLRPYVGDYIEYSYNQNDEFGKIENILPRKNLLKRPTIANVNQVILVTSLFEPAVDNLILDKFLVQVEKEELECCIVLNKVDLINTEERKKKYDEFMKIYGEIYTVIPISKNSSENVDILKIKMKDKISTMAGMSGVGKSSLLNVLDNKLELRTGDVSKKLKRGRHTTTYTELLSFDNTTFIADTPGFANLDLRGFKEKEIKDLFIEFYNFSPYCGFSDCSHIVEPYCAIKEAVEIGEISLSRYNNYLSICEELKKRGERSW